MSNWFLPQFMSQVRDCLGPAFPVTTDIPTGQSAWIAVPVFSVAKQRHQDIADVAEEVRSRLANLEGVTVEVSGGFVNITPTDVSRVLEQASQPNYGSSDKGAEQNIVVEFGGMNVAKPMTIGHLRSTIIGDSLQRILKATGYHVTSVNHLGDWGTQFGKLLVAYQRKFGDLEPRPLTVQDLLDLYVTFHVDAELHPELEDEARILFKRLEDGDKTTRRLWQQFVTTSVAAFNAVFTRLGVMLDEPNVGESFYEPFLNNLIAKAKESEVAQTSDGALIIPIPDESAPLLLQKSDGATLYATRDLATIQYRVETYHPAKILYVVANEQALHFRQVFAAAKLLGICHKNTELIHVKFGLVRLPEGKMSTRRGRVVFLEDVLREAISRARSVVEAKNPELGSAEKDQIAEVVGIGALKYFDLSHDRNKDIVFDWDQMLKLSGDSGPYLQYAYTRAAQILAKTGEQRVVSTLSEQPTDVVRLIWQLARFPLIVEQTAERLTPHLIAQYLNTLAGEFNRFYEQYPVLQAEGEERETRLAIVNCVSTVLKQGLRLLGIDVLGQM